MTEKIALITGANKGLGYETAAQLGRRGVTVLVGARSAERGEKAAASLCDEGIDASHVPLDVTDEDSVAAAARRVESAHGRLDILVNNAGIAMGDGDGNTSSLTVATARQVFETNVLGVVSVTNAFLPLIRRSEAGRIVMVSSEVGSIATMLRTDTPEPIPALQPGAYGASKSALNALTVSYAKEFRDSSIKVNAVTPGYTATDINGHQGWRTVEQGAAVLVEMALIGPDGPTGAFRHDGTIEFLDSDGAVPW
ncbi:SDR family oxidoreductase [Salininema proteolyticum]|uniref:SDR family oxidoreductase n=1 Tax=Salininema proteolyticum TaxID=1607685 RepID=A0ABV8TXB3_9ACTN